MTRRRAEVRMSEIERLLLTTESELTKKLRRKSE